MEPGFEARAGGRGHGGDVRFDLGTGPGLLGVDAHAALDLGERPQVDALVDAQAIADRGTAPQDAGLALVSPDGGGDVEGMEGVSGVAGAGVVQRNREPFLRWPGSR